MQSYQFYIMKIKGTAGIPDYIQVRDAHFTLVGYYRLDRSKELKLPPQIAQRLKQEIEKWIPHLPFGEVKPISITIPHLPSDQKS